jgi:class 3 adenylate cyclase
VDIPKTEYARSADGTYVAYQTFGQGADDLLLAYPWISHVELFWEDPDVGAMLRALARSVRVIHMDQRGVGLSDRMTPTPELETRMDDVRAVLDAAGSERPCLFGLGLDGGAICSMFAATYPERAKALLLWGGEACGAWEPDYPWGPTETHEAAFVRLIEETWGDEDRCEQLLVDAGIVSTSADPEARRRWARIMRNSASRGDAVNHERMFYETDFRGILPTIHVPTAVLRRGTEYLAEAEWVARQIPGAKLIPLPDEPDYPPYLGDVDLVVREVFGFLASIRSEEVDFDRVLATVLFTDIVGSTEKAADLGDAAWRELLEGHYRVVRAMIDRYRGTEIDTTGDGFLATFDGPARGVRCAQAIVEAVRILGLEIRAGLHTGEVETIDRKVVGIAVHTGARVGALAGPSQVLVSQTVKDLVAGSDLAFEDAGEHELKGVPDRWRLYRVLSD